MCDEWFFPPSISVFHIEFVVSYHVFWTCTAWSLLLSIILRLACTKTCKTIFLMDFQTHKYWIRTVSNELWTVFMFMVTYLFHRDSREQRKLKLTPKINLRAGEHYQFLYFVAFHIMWMEIYHKLSFYLVLGFILKKFTLYIAWLKRNEIL